MSWIPVGAADLTVLPTSSTVDPSRLGTSYNLDDGIDPTLVPPPTSPVPANPPASASVWARLKAGWDAATQSTYDVARASFEAVVQADPTGTARRVQEFIAKLGESRTNIDQAAAIVSRLPTAEQAAARQRLDAFRVEHDTFGAGLFADAPNPPPSTLPTHAEVKIGVAFVPVIIVVGIAGAAWAWAKYADLSMHTNQTALYRQELEARERAAASGTTLQPSTLGDFRAPNAGPLIDASGGGGGSSLLPFALAAGAVVLGGGWLLTRS